MKKLYLEFIRGAAALTVFAYHFLELHTIGTRSKHFYFSNWGTDAVIIFFILSGIVINISQSKNPKSKKDFIANRLLRLYPQLTVGLLLGILVLYVTYTAMPSFGVIAGNFFMLSTLRDHMAYIVPSIDTNGPIWSLSFEMFFYVMFALSIGRFQKKAIVTWFFVSLAVLPLYYLKTGPLVFEHIVAVLSFSSIWLIGYFVYEYRHLFYTDKYTALFSAGVLPLISRMHLSGIYYDPAKYLLFAIFAIPFFRYCLQAPPGGKKINLYYLIAPYVLIVYIVFTQPYLTFTNFVLYSGLPLGLMALCLVISVLKLKDRAIQFVNRTGATLGKYSYSLYIVHYPILFFCAAEFHSLALYLLVGVPVVLAVSYSLETWLQPTVVAAFGKVRKLYLHPIRVGVSARFAKA